MRRNLFSKDKVPIYAYAAQFNIFTSYWLTGWYASVSGGQIFDDDRTDSLGVMSKKILSHLSHFSESIRSS